MERLSRWSERCVLLPLQKRELLVCDGLELVWYRRDTRPVQGGSTARGTLRIPAGQTSRTAALYLRELCRALS